VDAKAAATSAPTDRSSNKAAKAADNFSVRVETAKLDHLMDMVGEMVIAQSLIRNNPVLTSLQNPRLLGDLSQLARITADVQRTTMGMRMIPMGQLFQRTARMVRDLSRKTGKVVELETSGEETVVDKNIAEELSDPLLHMVRNSLDHGIESPADRKAAGKNPTARVRLAAYHQAGQIVIEISDDGRGLDKAKILGKARQRGLIQDGAHLSENDIFHLIFEPGFSTADQISDISGRGVGMDVVRKNVQKLRGRIDIKSVSGKGATFILSLPLTLAIIDGLVVNIGGYRYIVPIFDVKEMIRPTEDMLSSVQGRDEMALIRGRLLPIVRLSQRFGVKAKSDNICDGLLVVAECEGKQFCLLVDDLVGKQEVVIKSLGETLKNITGIAGCAILGDGRVGLILDMHGIFRGQRP
jgi:two-component system chemotaxis sensor kinase CheA